MVAKKFSIRQSFFFVNFVIVDFHQTFFTAKVSVLYMKCVNVLLEYFDHLAQFAVIFFNGYNL